MRAKSHVPPRPHATQPAAALPWSLPQWHAPYRSRPARRASPSQCPLTHLQETRRATLSPVLTDTCAAPIQACGPLSQARQGAAQVGTQLRHLE